MRERDKKRKEEEELYMKYRLIQVRPTTKSQRRDTIASVCDPLHNQIQLLLKPLTASLGKNAEQQGSYPSHCSIKDQQEWKKDKQVMLNILGWYCSRVHSMGNYQLLSILRSMYVPQSFPLLLFFLYPSIHRHLHSASLRLELEAMSSVDQS